MSDSIHGAEPRFTEYVRKFVDYLFPDAPPEVLLEQLHQANRPTSRARRHGYALGLAKTFWRRRDQLTIWHSLQLKSSSRDERIEHLRQHEAVVLALESERLLGSFHWAGDSLPVEFIDQVADNLLHWLHDYGYALAPVADIPTEQLTDVPMPNPLVWDPSTLTVVRGRAPSARGVPKTAPGIAESLEVSSGDSLHGDSASALDSNGTESSSNEVACPFCNGEGCDYCKHTGTLERQNCPDCDGRGCSACDDSGKVTPVPCECCGGDKRGCARCEYRGYVYAEIGYVCPYCEGEEVFSLGDLLDTKQHCSVCGDSALLESGMTSLPGHIPIGTYSQLQALVRCPSCDEYGIYGCPNCDDKGFFKPGTTIPDATWKRCPFCSESGAGLTSYGVAGDACPHCRNVEVADWSHGDVFWGCDYCTDGWLPVDGFAERAADMFFDHSTNYSELASPMRLLFEEDRPYILAEHFGLHPHKDLREKLPAHSELDSLEGTDLNGCNFKALDLTGFCLTRTNLADSNCQGVNFSGVHALSTNFTGADLTGSTIEQSLDLTECDLRGAIGLTDEQKQICRSKGALVDR